MEKYIHIKSIKRTTFDGEIEELNFNKGVNVICGKPNAGKTTWLKQLDYILGKNASINEVFADDDLADKYIELTAIFEINNHEVIITRKPKEPGALGKVFINDAPLLITDFSAEILKKIGIPFDIKYPKANPFTSQWIELSFRSLFRHIYRREDLWGDIADKQPINEQFAAQFQFFGIAQKIFSKEFDQHVIDEKELMALEAQKQQYNNILNRIIQEMSPKSDDTIHFATESEVENRIQALAMELQEIESERNLIIENHLNSLKEKKEEIVNKESELIDKKIKLIKLIETNASNLSKFKKKINDYRVLQESIVDELGKLKRTRKSGVIADLKITHCPACDQQIIKQKKDKEDHHCFLCSQPISDSDLEPTLNRVDFELSQLDSEKKELTEIISELQSNVGELENEEKYLKEQFYYIELELAPLKDMLFTLSYQDLSEIDVRRGRIQEQIQTYNRLLSNISYKLNLAYDIQVLQERISKAKSIQENTTSIINFTKIAEDMENGMQTYVNRISKYQKGRELWSHKGKITVGINESKIAYSVNNKSWTSLGGQDKEIFLLSYHYGLLNLTSRSNYNFPGLVIIDLPPELGESKGGSYNYIVDPFSKYCKLFKDKKNLQVIFTGRSFDNLTDANIIELDTIWK